VEVVSNLGLGLWDMEVFEIFVFYLFKDFREGEADTIRGKM